MACVFNGRSVLALSMNSNNEEASNCLRGRFKTRVERDFLGLSNAGSR